MLSLNVVWKVKFYGSGQCIILKLSGYYIFLFSYETFHSFVRLQLALALLYTWPQKPIVKLVLVLARKKFFRALIGYFKVVRV